METNKRRIVVKVGTSTLTHETGALHIRRITELVRVLADLKGMGYEVILVTSAAISAGTARLGLAERPQELRLKQATAAVGQCALMHLYDQLFSEYNVTAAQILLTGEDIGEEQRAENLRETFEALLSLGVIPVVNENDSVSSAEIETAHTRVLGDNDTLSALVASLVGAGLLILLSDIDGLYDKNPKEHPEARLVYEVRELTEEIISMAGGAGSWRGTGGMVTKLSAAKIATAAGCDMVIANGSRVAEVYDIVAGKPVGTRFIAKEKKI
ncbi:MAG: glutamate 5-kinase [bacterium]